MIKKDILKAKEELKGDRITVGLATCGISAGAMPVFEKLKKSGLDIPIEKVGCIGMCYNEPIVTITKNNKKQIYAKVTEDNVEELIKHIKENKIYKDLYVSDNIKNINFFKKQKRLVMQNCGIINPNKISHYLAQDGYSSLKKAIKLTPKKIIEYVKDAKVRGRGGAGFLTGIKWSFLEKEKGRKFIICNGDEGDPGAFMNRTIMESDPFRIIEGMTIGSYATGAKEGIVYTRAEYPLAITTLKKAIDEAKKEGFLGKNILGIKGFNFDIIIKKGAGAFVCGEETALIESVEGKRGHPKPRPPYPAKKGVYKYPTDVNNVGTWANITTLFNIGKTEYKKTGTKNTTGTKIICLTGKIKRTGVIEVEFGTKLKDIVFSIGGGMVDNTKFKALLSGGPAGGCITKENLNRPLDYETLLELGSIMGSGGFIVTNENSCMVNLARYFINFTQEESCGKCTPCREGTKRLLELLTKVTQGIAKESDLKKIKDLAEFIKETSLCGLGQGAANPVLSTLRWFEDEYIMHIKDKKCPAGACENLLKFTITSKCTGCGNCKRNCPVKAISGELKNKHKINQDKCIKCGKCYEVCAFDAIEKK